MLTAIVATHESEQTLVPTLSALVPGATSGLLRDVIVADGGSRDATAEVADFAGCRFMAAEGPLGARLGTAAATAKGRWLLFLPAGSVLSSDWTAATERFIAEAERTGRADAQVTSFAAAFRPAPADSVARPALAELAALLRRRFGRTPHPAQGLLIARAFYDALGAHAATADADTALLRRIGRRRLVLLPATASWRGSQDT